MKEPPAPLLWAPRQGSQTHWAPQDPSLRIRGWDMQWSNTPCCVYRCRGMTTGPTSSSPALITPGNQQGLTNRTQTQNLANCNVPCTQDPGPHLQDTGLLCTLRKATTLLCKPGRLCRVLGQPEFTWRVAALFLRWDLGHLSWSNEQEDKGCFHWAQAAWQTQRAGSKLGVATAQPLGRWPGKPGWH